MSTAFQTVPFQPAPFEADVCPDTGSPRLRFNFDNGWSASVVLRHYGGKRGDCGALMASLAACPTGAWGTGKTELGETEATAKEVAIFLFGVASRLPGQ